MKEIKIKSHSRNLKHTVTLNERNKAIDCTCEHHKYRNAFCKHMKEAEEMIK